MRFTMKISRICLLVAMLLFMSGISLAQSSGFDQVGTTSFQFLSVVPNARAAAIGGASTATIRKSEAAFFNPALLTSTKNFDVGIAYLDWFLDVNISSVSLSYNMSSLGVLGFHAQVTNYGEIQETRTDQLLRDDVTGIYNPGLTGNTISASSMVFGVSFARQLTDRFSFGLTAKYAREDLSVASANALVFDGGVAYQTGFKTLELGIMLRNFGSEIKYVNESYPLPQTFAIGISGYLVGPGDSFFSGSENNNLLLAFDLAQTRDHSQQQHIGAEYSFRNLIALRGGYKFNFDEESWTAGFGLNVNRFSLDYSYNDFGEFLGNVQRFTLNVVFD